jgi:tetratricopeptide (TPR) repeat protein
VKAPKVPAQQNYPDHPPEGSQSARASLAAAVAEMSVWELGELVSHLRESLERLRQFVRDQEAELAEQVQAIADLETQLQSASPGNRQQLLQELSQERERRKMLEATLVGQRRNLQQQEAAYQQYWQLMQERKQPSKTDAKQRSVDPDAQPASPKRQQDSHASSPTEAPVFNLLSLGQRGVGKTVFLAGCYAEFSAQARQQTSPAWWLECQNDRDRENLDSIFNYIAKTGNYPPPTLKITDFNFSLKQRNRWGTKTFCYLRWWDIPGEYCDFDHPEFQKMVLNSQSCCVFINAERLLRDASYEKPLAALLKQVVAIANLLDNQKLEYGFAFIFTQCDRLPAGPMSRLQIEKRLLSLFSSLESANAKYQRFYSAIPLVEAAGTFKLQPTGAAAAFLWLASQLSKSQHNSQATLATSLQADVSSLSHSLPVRPKPQGKRMAIGLAALGVVAAIAFAGFRLIPSLETVSPVEQKIQQYQAYLQDNPDDFETLVALANLYLTQGQLDRAIPVMEKIVRLRPNSLDWQFNLAKLYELSKATSKAEKVYDRILSQDPRHFKALLGKALLRRDQGDRAAAKQLLLQAEQVAPSSDLKAKVRQLYQNPDNKEDSVIVLP